MKQIISKNDLPFIYGKWIVQLSDDKDEDIINSNNPEFWLEKRISFVGRIYGTDGLPNIPLIEKGKELLILNGFYYCHGVKTEDEFIEFFNSPTKNGKRYHRLLTDKELDWLNEQLKKRNY